jgi:ATP-dependent exoDNAse (exonuclease V) alpha subunit
MAIFHFHVGMVQRSRGQSVVAAAADRARVELYDYRLDRTQSPLQHKKGELPILSKVLLPDGAPRSWNDRETLWNDVERSEKRHDAALARELEFALPAELTADQAGNLAYEYVQSVFVTDGMIADLNVHCHIGPDEQKKPYAQVLLTLRRAAASGFGLKERSWNDHRNVTVWRRHWAEMANASLEHYGHSDRIDHRSHAQRGIPLEPQNKIGQHAARRARRGEPSERVDEHRAIAERNQHR